MNFSPKLRNLLVIMAIPTVIAVMFFFMHKRPSLDTFSEAPEGIAGCSCYYAKDKMDLVKKKFLFAKDSTGTAYVSIGGDITKFQLKSIKLLNGDKRAVSVYSHDEYELSVDLTRAAPKEPYKGTLRVKHNESEEAMVYLYGTCECQ